MSLPRQEPNMRETKAHQPAVVPSNLRTTEKGTVIRSQCIAIKFNGERCQNLEGAQRKASESGVCWHHWMHGCRYGVVSRSEVRNDG